MYKEEVKKDSDENRKKFDAQRDELKKEKE